MLFKAVRSLLKKQVAKSNNESPDGSMYFGDAGYCVFTDYPETYIQYEFSANYDEDNHDVTTLGLEIISQLCDGYTVLTEISSNKKNTSKNSVSTSDRFTTRYFNFLKDVQSEVSVHAESERRLCVLSKGFNRDIYFSYVDVNASDLCSFDYYLFRKNTASMSAKSAWEAVQSGCYDMRLLQTNGPIAVEFIVNPSNTNISDIWAVVKAVCTKYGLIVTHDPDDPNIN